MFLVNFIINYWHSCVVNHAYLPPGEKGCDDLGPFNTQIALNLFIGCFDIGLVHFVQIQNLISAMELRV